MLEEIAQLAQAEPEERRDALLAGVVELVAPIHTATARRLSDAIRAADFQALALVEIAHSLEQQGQPADETWSAAWDRVAGAAAPTPALVSAAARIGRHWDEAGDPRAPDAFERALETARGLTSTRYRTDALTQVALAVRSHRAETAAIVLREAEASARQLAEPRGRGRALALISGAWMDLDPARSCALVAELRHLGRENVLDSLAQMASGAVRVGGPGLVRELAEAVQQAREFFR